MAAISQALAASQVDVIRVEQRRSPVRLGLRRLHLALLGWTLRPRLRRAMREIADEGRPALLRWVETGRRTLAGLDKPSEAVFGHAMAGLEQQDFAVEGRRAGATFYTRDADEEAVVLYVPGGSFIAERSPRITALIGRLAQESGARMVVADYRLAPEHPCPAAVRDVGAVYDLLLATYPADRIVCAAESAGGAVLLAALQAARDAGRPMPAGLVLLSPWVDLTLSSWSVVSRSLTADSPFAMELAALCAQLYLDGRAAMDPLASPLFGEMHDLPEVLIHAGETDLLFDDSVRLAAKLRAAAVPVTLRAWPHEDHAFERFLGPEAERSIAEVAAFMKRTLRLVA